MSQRTSSRKKSIKNWTTTINLDSCFHSQRFLIQIEFHPGLKLYKFLPGMRFRCKQKIFQFGMSFMLGWDIISVTCKQPLELEIQIDAKNRRLTPVPVAIPIFVDITVSALRVSIIMSLVFLSNWSIKRLGLPELLGRVLSLLFLNFDFYVFTWCE